MSYRTRLLIVFAGAIALAVFAAVMGVSELSTRAFEERDRQRVATLVAQFRRDFNQRAAEVSRRVDRLAESDPVQRMALDLARPDPDASIYYNEAATLAAAQGLDLLTIATENGAIVSSAHWPARFKYKEEWLASPVDWNRQAPFLRREQLPEDSVLAVTAVRVVTAGDKHLVLAGGQKLDREFLEGMVMPEGMRAMLALPLENGGWSVVSAGLPLARADRLTPLLESVRTAHRELAPTVVDWTGRAADAESIAATPLEGRDGALLAVLLAGNARRDAVTLLVYLRWLGAAAALGGLLVGVALAWWAATRVTRPVNELANAARQVAAGDWTPRVAVRTSDELGTLASTFNQMTRQLSEQRERLVQAERVAAWRELARRLAHELKNPLFPLQITIENLQRARQLPTAEFDEVFQESTSTLLAELGNLKGIIARFSDFSKMPKPEPHPTDLNALIADAVKLYRAPIERASVTVRIEAGAGLERVPVDAEQIRRVLQNLLLNAIDAMPGGGAIDVRTSLDGATHRARIEVSDSGQGLTPEECDRLFTPYYTTRQHGTGLGLAIVQSVVSDHHGTIRVSSQPGHGATFIIELPASEAE